MPNSYSTATDTPALAQQQLQSQLRKRAGVAADASLPTDPPGQFTLLLAQYRETLGVKSPLPPLTNNITTAKKTRA
ncbi:MAG: hypothetical protein WDM77_20945 [Steroidobacteraceae bacterium]